MSPSMSINYLQSLLSSFTSKEQLFINALLVNNYETAKKLAFELYKKAPQFLFFYYFLNRIEHKTVLLKLIGILANIDPQTIYILLKDENFSYDELMPFQKSVYSDTCIGLCIQKMYFLKKYTDKELNDDVRTELLILLDKLDDFDLYNFAIKHNIAIQQREGINYKWYKLITEKDKSTAIEIILSSINFDDIVKALSYCSVETTGDRVYDILILYLNGKCPLTILRDSFSFLYSNKSFIAQKTLLALLIATKNEKMLILALYLSETDKFVDNYEISLINMFLYRYFKLFSGIRKRFASLQIKNTQLINLAYVWSDPMIMNKIRLEEEVKNFKREVNMIGVSVEKHLSLLITKGNYAVALSSLTLLDRVKTCVIKNEINMFKIQSCERQTMFSTLLGESCRYMFDKLTVNDERTKEGMVSTIRTTPAVSFSTDIFENEFLSIVDHDFITNIKKSVFNYK